MYFTTGTTIQRGTIIHTFTLDLGACSFEYPEPPSWKVIGANEYINKIYSNIKYIIKNNIIFYNIRYIRVFAYAHDYLLTNSLAVLGKSSI